MAVENERKGLGSAFERENENAENVSLPSHAASVDEGGALINSSEKAKKERKTAKKSDKGKRSAVSKKLKPLKIAAENIADMLSELSGDVELFVLSHDEKPRRRIDTKTLKEFSSVIKEITGVICELNGISAADGDEGAGAVKIEFDEEAEACSR